ncbi:hypothetical protein HG530_000742 [Fusarium avenaceum]|nr:hypothetical protein HG530_000742 [Fusarium avenaceum]
MRAEPASLLVHFPKDKQCGSDELHSVVLEEPLYVPGLEGLVTVAHDNAKLEDKAEDSAPRLETTIVGHLGSIDSLGIASSVKAEEGDSHNEHDDAETPNWNTRSGSLSKESRGTTLKSEAIERSCGTVSVCVTSREDRGEQESVDDIGEDADAQDVHSHDIGRGSSSAASLGAIDEDVHKLRVVVGDHNTDSKGSRNKEEAESIVNGLESSLDVDTRSLGLSSHHGDVFGTNNGEASTPEGSEEAFEATEVVCAVNVGESTGDQDDLAARQPEFGFTHAILIHKRGEDRSHVNGWLGDAGCRARFCNLGAPIGKDKIDRSNFEWNEETFVEEEVPSGHKTKSIVAPVTSKTDEATRNGHIGAHLCDTIVHTCEDTGVDCIGEKQTERTTFGKTTTDTHEKRCTDRATNGDELDLSVVEKTMQAIGIIHSMPGSHIAVVGQVLIGRVAIADEILGVLLLVGSHLVRFH